MSQAVKGKVRALRGLIYSNFDSESEFAKVLGWSRQKLNKITSGAKEPTIQEINSLALQLNQTVEEIAQIFLRNKSPNGQY